MIFTAILLLLFPVVLALEICLFVKQWNDRKNSLKNYRHFMHISLMCQSVAYMGRCADMLVINI